MVEARTGAPITIATHARAHPHSCDGPTFGPTARAKSGGNLSLQQIYTLEELLTLSRANWEVGVGPGSLETKPGKPDLGLGAWNWVREAGK